MEQRDAVPDHACERCADGQLPEGTQASALRGGCGGGAAAARCLLLGSCAGLGFFLILPEAFFQKVFTTLNPKRLQNDRSPCLRLSLRMNHVNAPRFLVLALAVLSPMCGRGMDHFRLVCSVPLLGPCTSATHKVAKGLPAYASKQLSTHAQYQLFRTVGLSAVLVAAVNHPLRYPSRDASNAASKLPRVDTKPCCRGACCAPHCAPDKPQLILHG